MKRPNRNELVCYALDILDTDRAREIEIQRDTDQNLNEELTEIEYQLGAYIAENEVVDMPEVKDGWRNFVERYPELGFQSKNNKFSFLYTQFGHLNILLSGGRRLANRRSLLFASLIIISVSVFYFYVLSTHSVSAEDFLNNATKTEIDRVRKVAEPVVYRRLQVKRKSFGKVEDETWETWQDVQKNQSEYHVLNQNANKHRSDKHASEFASQLAIIFQQNKFGQILSARAFSDWRNSISVKTDEIHEFTFADDQQGFELTTSVGGNHPINSILKASMIVRSNWQLVSQEIKVQDKDEIVEYSFSEIDYKVITGSEANINFDLNDDDSKTLFGSIPKSHTDVLPNINNENSDLSNKDLIDAEISVLVALHDMGADLDGQIDVKRGGEGQIIIQGDVSPILRKKIIDSVSSIPNVPLNFTKIEKENKGRPVNNRTIEIKITGSDDTELQRRVQQYYVAKGIWKDEDSNKNLVGLSRSVVSESEAAYRQAWALNQLHKKVISGELNPDHRIDKMKQDYIARIKGHFKVIRSHLQPALLSITDKQGLVVQSAQRQDELIYKSIDQLFRLVCVHFAGGEESDTDEKSAKDMLRVFMTLDGLLSN